MRTTVRVPLGLYLLGFFAVCVIVLGVVGAAASVVLLPFIWPLVVFHRYAGWAEAGWLVLLAVTPYTIWAATWDRRHPDKAARRKARKAAERAARKGATP